MTDSQVISDFSEMWLAVTDSVGVGGKTGLVWVRFIFG